MAYGVFEKAVTPPFLVYSLHTSIGVMADNKQVLSTDKYGVELYTKAKDFAAEALVESKFDENGAPYDKFETGKLASTGHWLIVYIVQTLGK